MHIYRHTYSQAMHGALPSRRPHHPGVAALYNRIHPSLDGKLCIGIHTSAPDHRGEAAPCRPPQSCTCLRMSMCTRACTHAHAHAHVHTRMRMCTYAHAGHPRRAARVPTHAHVLQTFSSPLNGSAASADASPPTSAPVASLLALEVMPMPKSTSAVREEKA